MPAPGAPAPLLSPNRLASMCWLKASARRLSAGPWYDSPRAGATRKSAWTFTVAPSRMQSSAAATETVRVERVDSNEWAVGWALVHMYLS